VERPVISGWKEAAGLLLACSMLAEGCTSVATLKPRAVAVGQWSPAGRTGAGTAPLPSGLSCASATFCMEVDRLGRAAVFSGAAWGKPQDVDPLDTQFGVGPGAASCFAAQSCAVLDVGFRLQFFDGQSWSQPGLSSPELSDVGPGPFRLSCTSKSFCVGLNPGSGGVAVYRSGRWSKPVALNGPSYSVSCA
jgi:hypothetical protein